MRVSGKHNDLENVGPSPRHHTFFEMLGNFSFGDYFKREAIHFAYECVTQVYGIDPQRLVFTVFSDDDEAFDAWHNDLGVPAERIFRMGEKTNFWMMGDTGPCGPTSELHYDWGPEACTCGQPDCNVALDNGCERWLEIWNLVFMQFNQSADGSRAHLPKPGVDTGMGLERVVSVVQNKRSNYDTDLFTPIVRRTQELLGHSEADVQRNIVGYRVVADHGRAVTFLIADGVRPGNDGRNYVLRMILRRAARFGKLIGLQGPFLGEIAQVVIAEMGRHYNELEKNRHVILRVIRQEEERFQQTLDAGLAILDELIADLERRGAKTIPGQEAFRLYDTYGFPLDLTRDIAREHGLAVDEVSYGVAMEAQRERARAAQAAVAYHDLPAVTRGIDPKDTRFVGYERMEAETRVLSLASEGRPVDAVEAEREAEIVLAETPFYAEAGGQVGDTGLIEGPTGRVEVTDTQVPVPGFHVHIGRVVEGTIRRGDRVRAVVDVHRRQDIMRNHTATHLLHRELRRILGEHAQQAGSLVAPDRFRFDFTHTGILSQAELEAIELGVNEAILANYPVTARQTTYDEAVKSGAMALFGEKYGDVVRVIRIGPAEKPFSQELCGGTHVSFTSEIGLFRILSEGSIGSGLRRIEAVTGHGLWRLLAERLGRLDAAAAYLGCPPEEVDRRVLSLLGQSQEQQKEIARLQRAIAQRDLTALLPKVQEVNGVKVLAAQVEAADMEILREMTDWLRDQLGSGVIVLGTVIGEKPNFVTAVTADLVKERGLNAGQLVKEVARVVGGSGGGRPTMAQAGGHDATRIGEALALVKDLVAKSKPD
jgi:alanyl-tRNA synthetase